MTANPRFQSQARDFWANVRTISQAVGYTVDHKIKVPSLEEVRAAYAGLNLSSRLLEDRHGAPSETGAALLDYFQYRAQCLEQFVRPRLMNADAAKALFIDLRNRLNPQCPLPMNKQKGDKKAFAFLTGTVNMLIEQGIGASSCNFDPRELTTITRDGVPLRTLARRVDGAFPSAINPVAVWEIKEYYYTTTFGSRVADGVYETLVDGMELEELREHEGIDVLHYLIIDSDFTWWDCGKSYLCRIIDMLHMGYVDEVLFGREVVERIPIIVAEWRRRLASRPA